MSTLYLVRHGQASFLEDDYDRLSDLGGEQARKLGAHWLAEGVVINEVYSGALRRQRETEHAVGEVFRNAGVVWPDATILPGLDEYRAEDFMDVLTEELGAREPDVRELAESYQQASDGPAVYKSFHRLLEAIMRHYVVADYQASGFESWREFHHRVTTALARIRDQREASGRKIAVFTSAGAIGVAVQTVSQAPEQIAVELSWRVLNASITAFEFRPGRITLDCFNAVTHLRGRGDRTYR